MDLLGAYTLTNFDYDSDTDGDKSSTPIPPPEPSKQDLRHTKTFRKIEKDIKDKNRRKRKEVPGERVLEFYVDKDRAISVGIGRILN